MTAGVMPRPPIKSRFTLSGSGGALPAQMLAHRDLLRTEGLAQYRDAGVRRGLSAHEDIERGIAVFRPGMDGDVAFGQHRHARNPAIRLEVMQVDMQQRG